jgi:VIT1/CCC1 family predicted Fe2+/Mn2+ transporter
LLVAGVAGAGLSTTDILLTAISGSLAGAVSMSSGEYVATKSQNQVLYGEISLEKSHIRKYNRDELCELSSLFNVIGIPPEESEVREKLIEYYENHPEALLKIMVALEFGVVAEEERSPWMAAVASGVLFLFGSLPSVLPFFARNQSTPTLGLIIAAVVTCLSLLLVGAIKTWATRGNCVGAAIENLAIAGFGGAFAYGIGVLFDKVLR